MIRKFLIFIVAILLAMPAMQLLTDSAVMGQINTLSGTGDSLTILLSGAATTTNPTYSLTYRTTQGQGIAGAIGRTNGTTPVTMVSGVGRGLVLIDQIVFFNADTAGVTLTMNKISGGVTYQLQKVTLPSLSTFTWNVTSGIHVTDNTGR